MARKRVGCYACFQTLDPKDKNPRLRTVVKCESCGALYHAACSEVLEACYRCAEREFNVTRIARPARLIGTTRQQAQSIKPSTVVIVDHTQSKDSGKGAKSEKSGIGILASIAYGMQTLWAAILALILVALAAAIGIYCYPVLQLPLLSTKTVMDAIFRADPPHPLIIIGTVASSLIAGFVFYSRPRQGDRHFTYLLAGVVGLVAFNSWLLDIYPPDVLLFSQQIVYRYLGLFYAQGITIIAIPLLIPLHRAMAPIQVLPERSYPAWLTNLYGWTRLLVASALVIVATVYFSTLWLAADQQPKVSDFYEINLLSRLTGMSIVTAATIAGALAIAAVIYWPPQFRRVKWRLGFIRLLIFIAGVVVIGFLYRAPINPELILVTLQYTGIMLLLGIPIQRALS